MSEYKKYYMECSCSHMGHLLKFTLDTDEECPELWSEIHLEDTVWYKRIYYAIKYIFGWKCNYGHFGCWTMDYKDCEKLRNMSNEFEKLHLNRVKKAVEINKEKANE